MRLTRKLIKGFAEDNYRFIFNAATNAMALAEAPGGRIIDVNDAWVRAFGISRERAVGRTALVLGLWADSSERAACYNMLRKKGKIAGQEVVLVMKGKQRKILLYAQLVGTSGKTSLLWELRDVTEWRKAERAVDELNECFLGFGPDPLENIEKIVNTAGRMLSDAPVLYNRLDGGLLCTWGIWHEPEGYRREDRPEGHICYDVIRENREGPTVIEDLAGTVYERTDPNVKKYRLRSYLGYPVRLRGKTVGSFCMCGTESRKFTEAEHNVMSVLARAIAVEEERRSSERDLREKMRELEAFHRIAVDRELLMQRLKERVRELEEKLKEGPR